MGAVGLPGQGRGEREDTEEMRGHSPQAGLNPGCLLGWRGGPREGLQTSSAGF